MAGFDNGKTHQDLGIKTKTQFKFNIRTWEKIQSIYGNIIDK